MSLLQEKIHCLKEVNASKVSKKNWVLGHKFGVVECNGDY